MPISPPFHFLFLSAFKSTYYLQDCMSQGPDYFSLPPNKQSNKKHISPKRIPKPTLMSNKLKINLPFLSPRHEIKNRKSNQDRSWTQRGVQCKTEGIQRMLPQQANKAKRNKEKDTNWDIVMDGKMSGGLGDRMDRFLNQNPQGKLSRFEDQMHQKQSQKIKRQLHNLEQIQTKLLSRIQTVNHEQGRRTQTKHHNHTRMISNDFLPSLKANENQIRKVKNEEKTINTFDGMVTFSPVGKGWSGREAYKSEDKIERKMKI